MQTDGFPRLWPGAFRSRISPRADWIPIDALFCVIKEKFTQNMFRCFAAWPFFETVFGMTIFTAKLSIKRRGIPQEKGAFSFFSCLVNPIYRSSCILRNISGRYVDNLGVQNSIEVNMKKQANGQ